MTRKIKWTKWKDPFSRFQSTLLDDGVEDSPYKVAATPVTIPVSVEESNCWIGSANFEITKPIASLISSYPGVDAFEVIRRYKFRIAIGEAFDTGTVRSGIGLAIKSEPNKLLSGCLNTVCPFWGVVINADGRHHFHLGYSRTEVEESIDAVRDTLVGLMCSWDNERGV